MSVKPRCRVTAQQNQRIPRPSVEMRPSWPVVVRRLHGVRDVSGSRTTLNNDTQLRRRHETWRADVVDMHPLVAARRLTQQDR